MNKKIIIGNWKMNKTSKEANDYLNEIKEILKTQSNKISNNIQSGIAPPATLIKEISNKKWDNLLIVAQNFHYEKSGSFTGELSIDMIKDAGAEAVIIGHSERRILFHETNQTVNKKTKIAIANHIIPIVCVGETLEEYEQGRTKEVIKNSIKQSLKNITQWDKLIIAYEPVWAIGTGKIATPKYAQQICKFIRKITSDEVIVQYGGSVKPENIAELMSQKDINGALVGGASLNARSFMKLLTLNK